MAKLSVLIITHNKQELAIQLAHSLVFASGTPEGTELLIYQSGNPKGLRDGYLRSKLVALEESFGRILVIEDPLNLGCTVGFNTLMGLAQGELLLLCNDDMIAGPNWFPPLEEALKDPTVGLVCPYLDNRPYGYLKEPTRLDIGAQIRDFYRRVEIGTMDLVESESNQPWLVRGRDLSKFDMADPIVNRKRWLGQWEDPLGRAWFSDWHACRKIRLAGFKTGMISRSTFYHYDHTTLRAYDQSEPGWTEEAARRYAFIWGTTEKDQPVPLRQFAFVDVEGEQRLCQVDGQ